MGERMVRNVCLLNDAGYVWHIVCRNSVESAYLLLSNMLMSVCLNILLLLWCNSVDKWKTGKYGFQQYCGGKTRFWSLQCWRDVHLICVLTQNAADCFLVWLVYYFSFTFLLRPKMYWICTRAQTCLPHPLPIVWIRH